MYDFGQFLRLKYDEFLGENYTKEDVYGVSLDMRRTRISLQLVLSAIYPEFCIENNTWMLENFDWDSILTLPTNNYIFGRKTCQL